MSIKEEFIDYMLGTDRIPNKPETFKMIKENSKEIFHNNNDNAWWLYKPFILHPDNRKKWLTGYIKKELNYFLNDMDFFKSDLEDFVMGFEKEAINLLRKEIKKQFIKFDEWEEENFEGQK